jgi:hypothetical protein
MSEVFARVAAVLDTGINEIAHAELYVPLQSDRKARLMSMTISGSTRVSVLGRGGDILSGASFPDSRGLPMRDGSVRQYSQSHARTQKTPEVTPTGAIAYIEGGMWAMYDLKGPLTITGDELPVLLGKRNGLLVRNVNKGQQLIVSFVWEEVP